MTAPNLAPLPEPDVFNGNYSDGVIEAYALTAYQSGLNAALDQVKSLIESMGQNKEVE